MLSTWNSAPLADRSALDTLAISSSRGSLRFLYVSPGSGPGLLRFLRLTRRAGLRIAPYSDTLRPCDASQIAP